MVRTRTLLTMLSLIAVAPLARSAAAQVVPPKLLADFPCVADALPSIGVPTLNLLGKAVPEPNAVCRASGLEELLLLTGRMIDRTAYSAARGVDAAQVALGMQRTFLAPIAELERAAGGLRLGDPDTTEVVIQQASAVSRELLLEVKAMKESMRKDPEVVRNLELAQASLNEVEYYGATASVGGFLFGRLFAAASEQERAGLALGMQRLGLASDFAARLPRRAANVPGAFSDTLELRKGISKVAKNAEDKKFGDQRAKAQVSKDLDRQRLEWQGLQVSVHRAR